MRALVLSAGGLFGAWQAGAWAALAGSFHPDLIVGASVGALNGYAIACGADGEALRELWLQPEMADFGKLAGNLQTMTEQNRPALDLAVVATDLLRMKPVIFRGPQVSWRHLAASCAVPWLLPQVRLEGRLYTDGGLLNPLPVWAAAELGATEILALHVLPDIPLRGLKPFVHLFRAVFGYRPALPAGVSVRILEPRRPLGSLRDALRWKRENIERWLAQGSEDVRGLDWPAA